MFNSSSLKRALSGLILGLITVLQMSGSSLAAVLVPVLAKMAAALGTVGVVHAAAVSTLLVKKYVLATLAAIIAIAQFFPGLEPYVDLLREIGGLLGATSLGMHIARK